MWAKAKSTRVLLRLGVECAWREARGNHNNGRTATRSEACSLETRLAHHLRCLREDATDPYIPPLGRLALVRDRAARNREIQRKLKSVKGRERHRQIEAFH